MPPFYNFYTKYFLSNDKRTINHQEASSQDLVKITLTCTSANNFDVTRVYNANISRNNLLHCQRLTAFWQLLWRTAQNWATSHNIDHCSGIILNLHKDDQGNELNDLLEEKIDTFYHVNYPHCDPQHTAAIKIKIS